jgi:hypothetical protein
MNAGRIVFHGTVQEAQKLFTSMDMICPPLFNPAEFYVNKISDPKVAADIVSRVGVSKVHDDDVDQSFTNSSSEDLSRVGWMRQVFLLSHRATLGFLHDPKHYLIELSILIVSDFPLILLEKFRNSICSQIFAFVITSVYSGVSFDSDSAVQDIKGFLVILATEVLFTFVYAVFVLVYDVLPLLRKETGDRLYSLSAYYVSIVLLMVSRVIACRSSH